MGVSTYYEVAPDSMLSEFASDQALTSAFKSMWGYGSGMYWWFKEIDEEEIEEITEGQSPAAVSKLKRILLSAEELPGCYIEKTHDIHETLLTSAFKSAGELNAEKLARVAISGELRWNQETDLYIVSQKTSQQLAQLMANIIPKDLVTSFDLGERRPVDAWHEILTSELSGLIQCYSSAAHLGCPVLLGIC